MKVSELAEELDVPASAVIEQCQRFGLDATWAGAELGRSDVVILRAELARSDPPHGGHADAVEEPAAIDADADGPPTETLATVDAPDAPDAPTQAVDRSEAAEKPPRVSPASAASMPELFEGDEAPDPAIAAVARPNPGGFDFAGSGRPEPDGQDPSADEGRAPAARNRIFDRGIRTSALALALALVVLVATNLWVASPWALGAAWIVAAVAVLSSTVQAAKARYRSSTHPDRIAGTYLATTLTALGVLAVVVFGLAIWTVVRSQPSADAPLGLSRPASVSHLRWGYARLRLASDHGWFPPAKDPGSCWTDRDPNASDAGEPRRADRVEVGFESAACTDSHPYEVFDRWSVTMVRDSPYPGVEVFDLMATGRCGARIERWNVGTATRPPAGATLKVEYPTAEAWARGDHDLTCVAVTAPRSTALSR